MKYTKSNKHTNIHKSTLHCPPWKVQQRVRAKSVIKSCPSHFCCEFIYMYLNLCISCILYFALLTMKSATSNSKKSDKKQFVSLMLWIYIYVFELHISCFCTLYFTLPTLKSATTTSRNKESQKKLSVSLLLWIYINVFLFVCFKFCCCPSWKLQQRAKSFRKSCPSHCCCESRDKHRLWGTFTCHAPTVDSPQHQGGLRKKQKTDQWTCMTKQYKIRLHATRLQHQPPHRRDNVLKKEVYKRKRKQTNSKYQNTSNSAAPSPPNSPTCPPKHPPHWG